MCLLKKCSVRLYMYQKFINFYIIWNLRAILIKQSRWRIWGPLSLNEVDVCTTLLSFYVWSHKINSDGLFLIGRWTWAFEGEWSPNCNADHRSVWRRFSKHFNSLQKRGWEEGECWKRGEGVHEPLSLQVDHNAQYNKNIFCQDTRGSFSAHGYVSIY